MRKKKKKNGDGAILAIFGIGLLCLVAAVAFGSNTQNARSEKSEEAKDIEEINMAELHNMLASAVRLQIWELAMFYRDEIKKREKLSGSAAA